MGLFFLHFFKTLTNLLALSFGYIELFLCILALQFQTFNFNLLLSFYRLNICTFSLRLFSGLCGSFHLIHDCIELVLFSVIKTCQNSVYFSIRAGPNWVQGKYNLSKLLSLRKSVLFRWPSSDSWDKLFYTRIAE